MGKLEIADIFKVSDQNITPSDGLYGKPHSHFELTGTLDA